MLIEIETFEEVCLLSFLYLTVGKKSHAADQLMSKIGVSGQLHEIGSAQELRLKILKFEKSFYYY